MLTASTFALLQKFTVHVTCVLPSHKSALHAQAMSQHVKVSRHVVTQSYAGACIRAHGTSAIDREVQKKLIVWSLAGQGAVAMEVMWKPERVLADLELSRQLMEKLDGEKGIQSNPLKPPAPQPDGDAAEQKGEEQPAAKQEPEEGKEPESVKEEAEAEAKPETTTEAEAKPEEATAENGTKPESEFPAVKLEKGDSACHLCSYQHVQPTRIQDLHSYHMMIQVLK